MNIVIIGTGNVASVFGRLLLQAGHTIDQVFGRRSEAAGGLATALHARPCSSWEEIMSGADLYVIALPDRVLYELPRLALAGSIVVHTAGSVPMGVLKDVSPDHGVIYPLQSLLKEMPVLGTIPLLVNASNKDVEHRLMDIACSLSADVRLATDHQRLQYHVAAVFVNNFTNHLYAVAETFCRKEDIDFNMLFALALETTQRLTIVSPAKAQTGPAVRNDQVTIRKHLELLEAYPLMRELYTRLTESIRSLHTHSG